MIFNLLTFLAALSTAGVAEWFSIVGIISIYAGAPYHAGLVLGIVLGFAKLINTSWLYRNWKYASWKIKGPLIYFLLALMMATSMGVFGFLTKSHLEQGAATVDNSAKVERLDQQIAREKSTIADDEKVIAQLDSAINSYIGKDKTDKAVSIRRAQAPQRKQLRDDIDVSQKKIDGYSEDKLKLTSEVRALQLEVGPIRYIAELFYGTGGDQAANIESAVKMFTLLIVSTLDPLAIILLIAANHQLLRIQDEKKKKANASSEDSEDAIPSLAQKDDKEIFEDQGTARSVEDEPNTKINEEIFSESTEQGKNAKMDVQVHGQDVEEAEGRLDEEIQITWPDVSTYTTVLPKPESSNNDINTETKGIKEVESEQSTGDANPLSALFQKVQEVDEEKVPSLAEIKTAPENLPVLISPAVSRVEIALPPEDKPKDHPDRGENATVEKVSQAQILEHNSVIRELLGNQPHFIPQKLNEEKEPKGIYRSSTDEEERSSKEGPIDKSKDATQTQITQEIQEVVSNGSTEIQTQESDNQALNDSTQNDSIVPAKTNKYPVSLSWLKEFKGD